MQTIVVVDDEPELCSFVQELLELEGYDVVAAAHPDQVEAAIGDTQPALFLIDIMLPSMSGIELAQQLRENGYGDVPMIAMSASKLMSHMASHSGVFTEAIDKPFEIDAFLVCIEQHLRHRADCYR
jgi:DNA-binding response OmpR family regulator